MTRVRRCIAVALIILLATRLHATQQSRPVELHSVKAIAAKNPIDKSLGRSITPIAQGEFSSVTVWQFRTGIASHIHREHDEVIYCTEGEGVARLGNEKIKMKAGDFVVIPPNVPHGVTVTSKRPMRGMSVFSPRFDGKDRVPVEELKLPG